MFVQDTLPPTDAPAFTKRLPASFVWPRYGGRSLVNLPPTVGRLLGVEEGWAAPTLEPDLLEALSDRYDRVVLFLVDGLGWNRLDRALRHADVGFAEVLERYGVLYAPITSVAPSTTSVATTVLLGDGAAPAETGMLGFTFRLPRLGLVANMLFWHPAAKPSPTYGELEAWALKPETFIPTPSSAEVLAVAGVPMRVIMPAAYSRSPLSRMRPRGAEIEGFLNAADMWQKVGDWLSVTAGKRAYAYVYYADFDTLSHRDGAGGPGWNALWAEFNYHLHTFLSGLRAEQRERTLLLVTADHGHVVTPPAARITYSEHPALLLKSAHLPGGEARHVYLYAPAGGKDELRAYAASRLNEAFAVLDSAEALAAGLYGDPARLHPETPRRLGDLSVLARGPHYLWDESSPLVMRGMHGALEPDEMLVPLIGLRLEGV